MMWEDAKAVIENKGAVTRPSLWGDYIHGMAPVPGYPWTRVTRTGTALMWEPISADMDAEDWEQVPVQFQNAISACHETAQYFRENPQVALELYNALKVALSTLERETITYEQSIMIARSQIRDAIKEVNPTA